MRGAKRRSNPDGKGPSLDCRARSNERLARNDGARGACSPRMGADARSPTMRPRASTAGGARNDTSSSGEPVGTSARRPRHCEERSDEAIQTEKALHWITAPALMSGSLAMTVREGRAPPEWGADARSPTMRPRASTAGGARNDGSPSEVPVGS
ncbi:MAG: hypothetical protein LBT00_12405 [Spirochaetaceae bacterium]|nr:hypothetical protein [Spirochaetaceae bacterium]